MTSSRIRLWNYLHLNLIILSGQKFIESIPKMVPLASFWKPEACSQTVLPDRSLLKRQKIGEKYQNWNILIRHFGWFSNTVTIDHLKLDFIFGLLEIDAKWSRLENMKRLVRELDNIRSVICGWHRKGQSTTNRWIFTCRCSQMTLLVNH